MQRYFYGTRLLAWTRRPIQLHFSFFSIVHQYSNWRFSVCLSVCLSVCPLRFFAFFAFRRCNVTSTVPAFSHEPADRFNFIFRFFRSYINTLIGGFLSVCVCVCVCVCPLR